MCVNEDARLVFARSNVPTYRTQTPYVTQLTILVCPIQCDC
jgi:hypothetical protein